MRINKKRIDSGKPYTDSITGLELCLTDEGYTVFDKKGQRVFQSLAFRIARQAYGHSIVHAMQKVAE